MLGTRGAREAGGGPDGLRSVVTVSAEVLREHPRAKKLYRAIGQAPPRGQRPGGEARGHF